MSITVDDYLSVIRAHMAKGDLEATEENLLKERGFWESGRLAYFVTSELDLDSDGGKNKNIKWDATHQSETSLRYPDGSSVDAITVPFVVAPGGGWRKKHNIDLGDYCIVEHKGVLVRAVFADVGPTTKIGEASVALHKALGYDRVRNGRIVDVGLEGTTRFLVFKDSGNGKCPTNEEIERKCNALFEGLR